MKFKKSGIFVAVLLVITTLFSSCAVVENTVDENKTNLEKIEAVVETIRTYNETYKDANKAEAGKAMDKDKEKIKKEFDKLNFDYSDPDEKREKFSITEADLELYLQTHSIKDFINLIKDLYNWFTKAPNKYKHDNFSTSDVCWCGAIEQMVSVFIKAAGDKVINLSAPETITKGYYIDNPDAAPQPRNEEVKNSTLSSYIKNTYTVTYLGDFAIEHAGEYKYDEGRYEWVDGVFYDEKASWVRHDTDRLYYKGKKILNDISADEKSISLMSDYQNVYLIYTNAVETLQSHYYTNIDIISLE